MSMISEAATGGTIRVFVSEIKKELEENSGKQEICSVLKRLGRFALTKFEWDTPSWAEEYERLFKE